MTAHRPPSLSPNLRPQPSQSLPIPRSTPTYHHKRHSPQPSRASSSASDLGFSTVDLPLTPTDLPFSTPDLPFSTPDLPIPTTDLPLSSTDLPFKNSNDNAVVGDEEEQVDAKLLRGTKVEGEVVKQTLRRDLEPMIGVQSPANKADNNILSSTATTSNPHPRQSKYPTAADIKSQQGRKRFRKVNAITMQFHTVNPEPTNTLTRTSILKKIRQRRENPHLYGFSSKPSRSDRPPPPPTVADVSKRTDQQRPGSNESKHATAVATKIERPTLLCFKRIPAEITNLKVVPNTSQNVLSGKAIEELLNSVDNPAHVRANQADQPMAPPPIDHDIGSLLASIPTTKSHRVLQRYGCFHAKINAVFK